jgi:hypothetical protein
MYCEGYSLWRCGLRLESSVQSYYVGEPVGGRNAWVINTQLQHNTTHHTVILIVHNTSLKILQLTVKQSLCWPGFQEGEAPRFEENQHMKIFSPVHRQHLPPSEYSWYSFLLEAGSTPGP